MTRPRSWSSNPLIVTVKSMMEVRALTCVERLIFNCIQHGHFKFLVHLAKDYGKNITADVVVINIMYISITLLLKYHIFAISFVYTRNSQRYTILPFLTINKLKLNNGVSIWLCLLQLFLKLNSAECESIPEDSHLLTFLWSKIIQHMLHFAYTDLHIL